MMRTEENFSDEELTAYLDGEADESLTAAIDAALEEGTDVVARLEALTLPMDTLKEAFSLERLGAPNGMALPQMPELSEVPVSRTVVPWRLAASVVLALGVGGLGGYSLQPKQAAPGWIDVVANYQALYVTDTVADLSQSQEAASKVLADFEAQSGAELIAATSVDGLDFKRAQVLGFKGKPLMQMAYLDDEGVPFALCVVKSNGADSQPSDRIAQGLAATSWVSGGHGYLVIGGKDPAKTRAVAEKMISRLELG